MKVEVVQRFQDKNNKEINEVGDVLEITKERYLELQRFVEVVEEVAVTKKAKK